MVLSVQIANDTTLITVNVFFELCVKKRIPTTKNTICAKRKGMVNSSTKTPTKTWSIW